MKNNGKIDVIIPVYNGEKFISQAIESVLNQTVKPNKIIIVDDGSTDSTEHIVKSFVKKYSNIYSVSKKNRGLSSARNKGLKLSSSEYIAFLDADDVWEKTKLQLQLKKFKTSDLASLGGVYCGYCLIDESGARVDNQPIIKPKDMVRGDVYKYLFHGNIIAASGSGIVLKRDCFVKMGIFDENMPSCEDWDMWLRIAKVYKFDFVDKELVKIRTRSGSLSSNEYVMDLGKAEVLDKIIQNDELDSSVINLFRRQIILHLAGKKYDIKLIKSIRHKVSEKLWSRLFGNKLLVAVDSVWAMSLIFYLKIIKPYCVKFKT